MSDPKLERELKLKEIVTGSSTTILALYVVVFGFLGKSLFVLSLLGFWLVFLPVWLLGASAILSAISVVHDTRVPANLILLVFSLAVVAIPITMGLVYSHPLLFWPQTAGP
jgi:uncharacterized membrane protein